MEFDYVIVGGGSAGAVMAARLSEDPATRVCLVEAGGQGNSPLVRAPALMATMISGRPKINNWAFKTVPQKELGGRKGFHPRGRCLGGSSAINAMLYIRGHPLDFDEWATMGCHGWDWASVLPWFRRAEANARGADALHGEDGPLQVADQSEPREISQAFVTAGTELQIPENTDFNGPEQEGIGLYQVTQFHDGPQKGARCSSAAAYLTLAVRARANLEILTRCPAHRVIIDAGKATGVDTARGRLSARREVILAAGVFGSPQMLMLSGIGPGAELQRHGIDMIHESPDVGENLQDHLDYTTSYRSLRGDTIGLNPKGLAQLAQAGLQWGKDGTGLFATPYAEAGAFLKSEPGLKRPDLQLHFVIGIVDDHMRRIHTRFGYSCHVCVLRPASRGRVRLRSANAKDAPLIDPAYLSDRRDLDLLMAGARQMEAVLEAPALAPWRGARLYPHDGSDAALEADIRARADTIYHPVGTCRMGSDPSAVCDAAGRVRGVDRLRVVDASLMPKLIGGNTNAPVIMMAEKIVDQMRMGQ